MTSVITPPHLRPGDTIGIAAPASAFRRNDFHHGLRRIREAGYETMHRADIFQRQGYLAGSDERRASELLSLFADRRIAAIFCARGGYGSQRILPLLDRKIIRDNPTLLMGYSDITALHCYLGTTCGIVSFHGPLVTELGGMTGEAVSSLLRQLGTAGPWGELPTGGVEVIRPGCAEGVLAGGSLTLFASLRGTPYQADTAGAILFFEDRGEKPYAVDRLFRQLKLGGVFDSARGVILGKFIPPRDRKGDPGGYDFEIRRIVLETLGEYDFPILGNFPAGHFSGSICFPLGVKAAIDGARGTVAIVEPCLE